MSYIFNSYDQQLHFRFLKCIFETKTFYEAKWRHFTRLNPTNPCQPLPPKTDWIWYFLDWIWDFLRDQIFTRLYLIYLKGKCLDTETPHCGIEGCIYICVHQLLRPSQAMRHQTVCITGAVESRFVCWCCIRLVVCISVMEGGGWGQPGQPSGLWAPHSVAHTGLTTEASSGR